MLVHKGGQINNVQLITGVRIAVSKYSKSTAAGISHEKEMVDAN